VTLPAVATEYADRTLALRVYGKTAAGSIDVGGPVTIVHTANSGPGVTTRIAGWDRYDGSVVQSHEQFDNDSLIRPPMTLASGEKFADSLSAAAATAHVAGSLLLVKQGYDVNQRADREAGRLRPSTLVTVGGPESVSDWVAQGVANSAVETVSSRVGGADRYEVSRKTAERFWPDGAATVFVATGLDFPDALAAVPAAASQEAPMLLVPGSQKTLDQSTLETLATLEAQHIVIVGGPKSVSPGIASQLDAQLPGDVERITGADRYEVSTAVNTRFFPTAQEAFVATGATFADALTGGVLAASKHAPLLLVRHDCVPVSAHAALESWGVSRTTLLGGPASLESTVEDLVPCR
jgi:putative cell wall-binding protein